jgi:hypothetical protein
MNKTTGLFLKGMGNLTLFPKIETLEAKSPWDEVGDAFCAVGDDMRRAMYEFERTKPFIDAAANRQSK